MTRKRKIAFGGIALVLAVTAAESSARLYAALRHGNARALSYGLDFATRMITEDAETATDIPFANVAEQEAVADRVFEQRHDRLRDDGWYEALGGRQVLAGNVMATVNRNNFRGREFPPFRDGDPPRIGIFGGSFVFGHGLGDDDTWPAVLERRLRDAGRSVDVFNLGENGSNIHGVVINLIRASKRLDLDYAVLISAYNNHSLLRMNRSRAWARKADFYLYNLSIFHVLVKEKLSVASGQPVDYGLYRQEVSVEADAVNALIRSYRRRLEQAVVVCRERGIALVLAAQPQVFFDARIDALDMFDSVAVNHTHEQIARGESVWLMDLEYYLQARLNAEVRSTAAAHGLPFVDLANLFVNRKSGFFIDQIHPNVAGSEMIANALVTFFAPRLAAAPSSTR